MLEVLPPEKNLPQPGLRLRNVLQSRDEQRGDRETEAARDQRGGAGSFGAENEAPRSAKNAVLVALGIFLSRIAGLVRQRFFAHYLGLSDAADAFSAAFRLPNFLQNLFGEGVLSASLIPVYARLLAEGKKERSDPRGERGGHAARVDRLGDRAFAASSRPTSCWPSPRWASPKKSARSPCVWCGSFFPAPACW